MDKFYAKEVTCHIEVDKKFINNIDHDKGDIDFVKEFESSFNRGAAINENLFNKVNFQVADFKVCIQAPTDNENAYKVGTVVAVFDAIVVGETQEICDANFNLFKAEISRVFGNYEDTCLNQVVVDYTPEERDDFTGEV